MNIKKTVAAFAISAGLLGIGQVTNHPQPVKAMTSYTAINGARVYQINKHTRIAINGHHSINIKSKEADMMLFPWHMHRVKGYEGTESILYALFWIRNKTDHTIAPYAYYKTYFCFDRFHHGKYRLENASNATIFSSNLYSNLLDKFCGGLKPGQSETTLAAWKFKRPFGKNESIRLQIYQDLKHRKPFAYQYWHFHNIHTVKQVDD